MVVYDGDVFVVVVVKVEVVDDIFDLCWDGFDDVIIILVLMLFVEGERGECGEFMGEIGDLGGG